MTGVACLQPLYISRSGAFGDKFGGLQETCCRVVDAARTKRPVPIRLSLRETSWPLTMSLALASRRVPKSVGIAAREAGARESSAVRRRLTTRDGEMMCGVMVAFGQETREAKTAQLCDGARIGGVLRRDCDDRTISSRRCGGMIFPSLIQHLRMIRHHALDGIGSATSAAHDELDSSGDVALDD
jgi:hypothetical protein